MTIDYFLDSCFHRNDELCSISTPLLRVKLEKLGDKLRPAWTSYGQADAKPPTGKQGGYHRE